MDVLEFDDPAEFRSFVDPVVLASEAENCLLLGTTGTLITRPEVFEGFHLWAVAENGNPVGAAAMAPPGNLLLAHSKTDEWLHPLARHIASQRIDLPGVQGNSPAVERFCDTWSLIRSVEAVLEMKLGVHAAKEVSTVTRVPGASRRAADGDLELLIEWFAAFLEEADPAADRSQLGVSVQTRVSGHPDRGGIWLWEVDGDPMSLSGYGGPTPNGIRIGPVYTPPSYRQRGFATALVAAQTKWLLGHGRRLCFLFTDMSNPTTNAIYGRIGYRKVANVRRYGFRYGFRSSQPSE